MASTSSFQHRCVFVGNIPYDATEEQLIQICEEVGPVVSFRLVLDRETRKPKGYGFCEYKDEETALSARRNLQGYEINGRQLRVDFAENDKGADRNREQGRGGTGLTSGTDAQKSLNGYPIGGDAVLQQPFGVPLAASAASLIAEALNGSQTSGLLQPKSNLLSVSGSGTDSLTLYLAKFSRHQLNEIITEMKAFAAKDKALAEQLLKRVPQLPKALFQALIMLGMMNPQMMQMASKSSEVAYSSVQDVHQDLKPVLPLYHGQVPSQTELVEKFLRQSEPLERNTLASASVFQSSGPPSKLVPLSAHQPSLVKNQIPAQGTVSVVSGDQMHLNIHARHLPSVGISLPQEQPSLLHHHRPIRISNISDHPRATQPITNVLQPLLARPSTSQFASLNHPMLFSEIELLSKETKASRSNLDLTSTSKVFTRPSASMGLVKHNEIAIEEMRSTNHVSKHPRSDERDIPHKLIGGSSSLAVLAQSSDPILLGRGQKSCTDGLQDPEKRIPQLSSEEESALLQQLMSLTPEQLSSLPPEQQQQVLVIQQTLRSKTLSELL